MNTQYPFLQNPHFGNISPYRNGSDNFKTFSCDFVIVTGDGNASYIVLFIIFRLSTKIQLRISGLLTVMGKSIKNAYLGIVKHDWTSIVCWRAYRKPFLSARDNIWNFFVVFYNKTTCLLRHRVESILLFSIISPWS